MILTKYYKAERGKSVNTKHQKLIIVIFDINFELS